MDLRYVIITPARNEEENIARVFDSMIAQTVLPMKWVVVSDGSTDRTDEIIQKYLGHNEWIEFVKLPAHKERNFAAKVNCFNAGYEIIKHMKFDIIGNLDADISFDPNYFEFLLAKFGEDEKLGVAGTPFIENGEHYDYRFTNIEHVSGACQLFRKKCFEDIGGYTAIKGGGIDWVAVTTARMKGWKTRTFTEKTCIHHRKIGTGNAGALSVWHRQGIKDYVLGSHPLWELARTLYQLTRKPYVLGGSLLFLGFFGAAVAGRDKCISVELERFIRKEQMLRLKNTMRKVV